jgi:acetyl esterase/lipase
MLPSIHSLSKLRLVLSTLAMLLMLSGCSALGTYNYLQVGSVEPAESNLAYGTHPRQTIDIYLPASSAQPAPLLVWFYGGGWDSGNKSHYAFVASRFTELGYAVAIPDYRLVPEVQFPAFLNDGAVALKRLFVYAELNPEKISAQPVILAGHSAGAYIAVQMVADPRYLASVDLTRQDIAGIIGLSGPYDFYPYVVGPARAAFGEATRAETQPVVQNLDAMPPLLLITGDRDKTVKPLNSVRLAEAAPDVRLESVPGMAHAGTLLALGKHVTTNERVLGPIREFLTTINGDDKLAASEQEH